MYLTARPYLLAGFTAATIVAAIPLVSRPDVRLPSVQRIDVHLTAAESQIATAATTLRAAETRVLASLLDRASTAGVPDNRTALSTRSLGQSPSSVDGPAATHRVTSAAPAGAITPSDLVPLIADVAAFNFDLLGAPFGVITALSFAGDLAISDLSSGDLQDIPGDVSKSLEFSVGSTVSLLSADINVLTNAVSALSAIIHPAPRSSQGAVGTGAVGAPKDTVTAAPRALAGTFDLTAIASLVGGAATLGLDAVATPFQLAQSLTGALSGVAVDLGAGQVQDAEQDFASRLRVGFVEAQFRLDNDLSSIGAALARLTGASSTTAGTAGAAPSAVGPGTPLEGAKTAASTAQSHPGAVGTVSTTSSAPSQHPPSRAPRTAKEPTRPIGGNTAVPKPGGQPPAAARHRATGTSAPKHSAPGRQHSSGPKHGKH